MTPNFGLKWLGLASLATLGAVNAVETRRVYELTVTTTNNQWSLTSDTIYFQIEGTTGTTEFIGIPDIDTSDTAFYFDALVSDIGDPVSLTILTEGSNSLIINEAGVDGTTVVFANALVGGKNSYNLKTNTGCSYITISLDGSLIDDQTGIGAACDKTLDEDRRTYGLGVSTGNKNNAANVNTAYFRIVGDSDNTEFVGTTAITTKDTDYYFYAPLTDVGDADRLTIYNEESELFIVDGANVDGAGFNTLAYNFWLRVDSGYEGIGCSYIEVGPLGYVLTNKASNFRSSECDISIEGERTYEIDFTVADVEFAQTTDNLYFRLTGPLGTTDFYTVEGLGPDNTVVSVSATLTDVGDVTEMLLVQQARNDIQLSAISIDGNEIDFGGNVRMNCFYCTPSYGRGCSLLTVDFVGGTYTLNSEYGDGGYLDPYDECPYQPDESALAVPAPAPVTDESICDGASHETYSNIQIGTTAYGTVLAMEAEDFQYIPFYGPGLWVINDTIGATGGSVDQFRGDGYMEWTGDDQYYYAGEYPFSTKVLINEAGAYKFMFRTQTAAFGAGDEHNDAFVRVISAARYFGTNGSVIVCPNNENEGDIVESSDECNTDFGPFQGWFKTQKSECSCWNWKASVGANHVYYPDYVIEFDSPDVYTIEITARSNHFYIDRIALVKPDDGYTYADIEVWRLNNLDTPCL